MGSIVIGNILRTFINYLIGCTRHWKIEHYIRLLLYVLIADFNDKILIFTIKLSANKNNKKYEPEYNIIYDISYLRWELFKVISDSFCFHQYCTCSSKTLILLSAVCFCLPLYIVFYEVVQKVRVKYLTLAGNMGLPPPLPLYHLPCTSSVWAKQ